MLLLLFSFSVYVYQVFKQLPPFLYQSQLILFSSSLLFLFDFDSPTGQPLPECPLIDGISKM